MLNTTCPIESQTIAAAESSSSKAGFALAITEKIIQASTQMNRPPISVIAQGGIEAKKSVSSMAGNHLFRQTGLGHLLKSGCRHDGIHHALHDRGKTHQQFQSVGDHGF